MKCRNCGAEMGDREDICSKCGTRQEAQTTQEKRELSAAVVIAIGAAVLAVIALIVVAVFLLPGRDESVARVEDGEADAVEETIQADLMAQNQEEDLIVHKDSEETYPVAFYLYSAMDVVSDENGTDTGGAIQNATAVIREGAGNDSGEPVCTVKMQEGTLSASLPSGVYTVQFQAQGYLDSFMEVEVAQEGAARDVYLIPGLAETQTGVVLTWDNEEVDLDLTLFTPYEAENGGMDHIGGKKTEDGHGNILVLDNRSRCETMFINSGKDGSYKLYVNNYTDSLAGNYDSDALCRLNVHIYLYNSDGFVAEYTVPVGQNGVVWEVAEINGRTVTPANRMYREISGESWWLEDKSEWNAEDDAALLACLEREDSELYELMIELADGWEMGYDREISALIRGEKEGIEFLFGLDSHDIGMAFATNFYYVNENLQYNEELSKCLPGNMIRPFLAEEKAEDVIYSICGKRIDFDFTAYKGWVEPYIGFDPWGDGGGWLEHFSVERVGANTWNVRANHKFCECSAPDYPVPVASRIRFTVVKNSNSYFDGYSITDFAVEEKIDNSGWAKAYYDYLTAHPDSDGIVATAKEMDVDLLKNYSFIYVDDNQIPELCLIAADMSGFDGLLYIVNGQVVEDEFGFEGVSYIPYTGLLRRVGGWHGGTWEHNYKLENGRMEDLGGWDSHWSDIDPETENPIELPPGEEAVEIINFYDRNRSEITKAQYDEMIHSYFGTAKLQDCRDECVEGNVLDALEQLMY